MKEDHELHEAIIACVVNHFKRNKSHKVLNSIRFGIDQKALNKGSIAINTITATYKFPKANLTP